MKNTYAESMMLSLNIAEIIQNQRNMLRGQDAGDLMDELQDVDHQLNRVRFKQGMVVMVNSLSSLKAHHFLNHPLTGEEIETTKIALK